MDCRRDIVRISPFSFSMLSNENLPIEGGKSFENYSKENSQAQIKRWVKIIEVASG